MRGTIDHLSNILIETWGHTTHWRAAIVHWFVRRKKEAKSRDVHKSAWTMDTAPKVTPIILLPKGLDWNPSASNNSCLSQESPMARLTTITLLALGFSHPGLQKVTRPHGNAALVKSHPAREKSPVLC